MAKTKTKSKTATRTKTTPWDSAAYLKTEQDIAEYLEAVFEDGDPALIRHALGDVARSKGMTKIARNAGLGRESLYKALSPDGNPEFATVLKVLQALGLKLKVAA
jgi:probable addiction module antidote protein